MRSLERQALLPILCKNREREREVHGRGSERKEMNACNDLNFPQWEHIMHHQLITIGEVGIYNNAIHTSSEGVCVHIHAY